MTPARPGLLDEARSILAGFKDLTQDRVRLAALETRLAGQSAVRMLIAGVVAAVLAIATWLALVGAGVVALVAYAGLAPVVALLVAAAANGLAAFALYVAARRLSRNLAFPRTVGSLH